MKNSYILFLFLLLLSCNNEPTAENQKYDTTVDYNYDLTQPYRPSDRLSKNTLYLFFEQQFKNDTIDIYLNRNSIAERKVINTDEILDVAYIFEHKNMESINSIKIQMNSGPILHLKIDDPEKNMWQIIYWADTLRAQPLRSPPMYD